MDEIRAGNETAFEVAYERHWGGILSFCRHMLGSTEDAEEAVQHTFAAAWSDLQRNERPVRLKPWLYAVARNRCLSMLRSRRETAELSDTVATAGLADEVAQRSDLRALLADLRELPDEQRAALVLSELGDLSHADIAEVVGRKEADVKAIVFRARSTLADWREARETPCEEIKEQLSVLTGGALRRRTLRHHLQHCPGCREFRDQVKAQRRMLALVLPVVPSIGLKRGVLAAAGLGGGAAGGGAAAGGAAGIGAALGPLGGATVAKVAVVGAIAGGAITAGDRVLERGEPVRRPSAPVAAPAVPAPAVSPTPAGAAEPDPAPRAGNDPKGAGRGKTPGAPMHRARGLAGPRGASTLAPPETPVRAKGSPPALGRVNRGLSPPATGPRTDNGRALGGERWPAAAPKQKTKQKALRPERVTPAPTEKPKPARPERDQVLQPVP